MKEVESRPIMVDSEGIPYLNLCDTDANDDWIRAARLKKEAESGNKDSKKKFEKMDSSFTTMFIEEAP